jgi:hypothetical protein
MDKKVTVMLLTFALLIFGCTSTTPPSQQPPIKKPCDSINRNPPELTFELSYCQGDMCSRVCDANGGNCHTPTKEECEKIDVVKGEDISKWGQDGIADCEWVQDACTPNK